MIPFAVLYSPAVSQLYIAHILSTALSPLCHLIILPLPLLFILCVPFPISFTSSVSPQPLLCNPCLPSFSCRLPLTPPFLPSVSHLSHRCFLSYVTSYPFLYLFPALLPYYAWLSFYLLSLLLLPVFPLFFQPSHQYRHFLLKVFPFSKFSSRPLPIPPLSPLCLPTPSVSPLPSFYLNSLFPFLPYLLCVFLCFPIRLSCLSSVYPSIFLLSLYPLSLQPSVSQPRARNVCLSL